MKKLSRKRELNACPWNPKTNTCRSITLLTDPQAPPAGFVSEGYDMPHRILLHLHNMYITPRYGPLQQRQKYSAPLGLPQLRIVSSRLPP